MSERTSAFFAPVLLPKASEPKRGSATKRKSLSTSKVSSSKNMAEADAVYISRSCSPALRKIRAQSGRSARREFTSLPQARRQLFGGSKRRSEDENLERKKRQEDIDEKPKETMKKFLIHKEEGTKREEIDLKAKDEIDQSFPNHIPLTMDRRSDSSHVPYYLVNFQEALRSVVVHCPDDARLLTEEEIRLANLFLNNDQMSLDAKRLYVRLFSRKQAYLNPDGLKYKEIQDVHTAVDELTKAGLVTLGSELDDLETMLRQLSAPNLKEMSKQFRVSAGKKDDTISALLKHSKPKTSITAFFAPRSGTSTSNPLLAKMKQKAMSLMGRRIQITAIPRATFMRILSLYSLTNFWEEREPTSANDNRSGSYDRYGNQLTTMLLVNQGKMKFPLCTIVREQKIFRDRSDLLMFEEACGLESEMGALFDNKKFEEAAEVLDRSLLFYQKLLEDQSLIDHAKRLPSFLRRFTSPAVVVYAINKGVDVLERLKRYEEATSVLRNTLLAQKIVLNHHRGHWYERLSLDLEQHLKRPSDAAQVLFEGLHDEFVREARRLTLCDRLRKMSGKADMAQSFIESLKGRGLWLECLETPSMTIPGRMLPKTPAISSKSIFMLPSEDNCHENSAPTQVLCSVEDFVREHFRRELDFPRGEHAESSVAHSLCTVLFWDCFYDTEVPDAFRAPFQNLPLDADHDEFFENRREFIEQRLEDLEKGWNEEELENFARHHFEFNKGCVCPVKWEMFRNVDDFLGLLRCFKRGQLAGFCRRILTQRRHTRSGFPDLTVWNPQKRMIKFVEVKGPNDKLSSKQILWIDFLNSLGLDACVCHVEAMNGRRKRRSASSAPSQSQSRQKRSKICDEVILLDEDDFE